MEFGNLLRDSPSENEHRGDSDRPIVLHRRKKRQRKQFIAPSRILQVFPDVEPAVLVQLAELGEPTPSQVLSLVPNATSADIAAFFDALQKTPSPSPEATPIARSKRHYAQETSSLIEELKEDIPPAETDRYCVCIQIY